MMDYWRSERERKTKNYLEKDSRELAKQSWVKELAKAVAQDRKCWSDSVEALCAYRQDEAWRWLVFTAH